MKLSEVIKNYRKEHGISQRQLAKQCDLSNSYISLLEQERNPKTGERIVPNLAQISKLATGMGMTAHALLSIVDDMPVDISEEPATSPVLKEITGMVQSMSEEQLRDVMRYIKFIKQEG